ncbi:MAG: translation initiation factor IF-2 subunit gamma [Candidatus Diapherotrites archaeon]|nr:translation initiation factor IF-2 subunit gamma [Candidatus Diapherotrites archaeon]
MKKTKKEKKPDRDVQSSVNIGLIGHVDAGKTSLVEALTGKWVDTHSEELKRGISIRIGYADANFYKCPNCGTYFSVEENCPKCKAHGVFQRKVSFVDAPGHETLMTTMLSGAALMHGAILVVAANEDCPQAQTIEHLNAIKMSKIDQIVVVQNKIDLVTKDEALKNYAQIQKFLKSYSVSAPVIPTAAHLKVNISALIEALETHIKSPLLDENKPLKMYCGRSFDVNIPGTEIDKMFGGVLGGTILQGSVKVGDAIEISPGFDGKKVITTVCNISTASGKLDFAKPGGLIAIETTLDPSTTQNDQMKGQLIGAVGTLPEPAKEIELEVHYMDRTTSKAIQSIKIGESLVLTIGTMTSLAIVKKVQGNKISAQLKKEASFWKGQTIAISKQHEMRWRLVAYGIAQ